MGNYVSAVYGAVLIYYIRLSTTVKSKIGKTTQDESSTREGLLENSNEHEINLQRDHNQFIDSQKIDNIISSIKLNVSQINKETTSDKKNEYQLLKNKEDCEINIEKENSDFYKLRNELKDEILDFEEKEEDHTVSQMKEGLINSNSNYEKEI